MSGKPRIATIVAFCAVLIPGSIVSAATLSGRAYEGNVGDESHELAGVTVSLYGAPEAGGARTHIVTQTTAASGWYGLSVEEGFEHYYIVAESGPDATYTFEGATSVGGSASGNEIHYSTASAPLDEQTLTGNKFWYKKEGPPPPENRPPVANDDSDSTSPETPVTINVLANDSDPDGDALTVQSVTDPPHGSVVNNGNSVTYTPDPGFTGTDTFDYTAGDGRSGTDTATVTVTVADTPPGTGTLDGYKREQDSGQGLENWRIYIDVIQNGHWDEGEPSDMTDSSGYYQIPDVEPGTYRVCEEMQDGWEPGEGGSVCVEGVNIIAGTTTTLDFRNRRTEPPAGTGTIRGTKYHDLNWNGRRDPDEPGLANWKIYVSLNFDDHWDPCEPYDITDDDGTYSIAGLEAGLLNVREVPQPGWERGVLYHGFTLSPSEVREGVDFGNRRTDTPEGTGTIRGTKFNDANGNRQRDAGELGLAGWEITLEDDDGNVLATATTDDNGDYEFSGLEPGVYRVDEVQQSGWRQTYPEADGQPAWWAIGLEPDAVIDKVDFGNREDGAPGGTGEIHGRKWNDRDGQGDPDGDEEGLPGWRIFAELEAVANGRWDPGEPSAMTDDQGYYVIMELSPGTYRVSEEGQSGWTPTFPPEKHYPGVMLSQGQVLLDLDFANRRTDEPGGTGEIRGRKWNDRDGQGLPGWTIFAELEETADGQWQPGEPFAITDDLGNYVIEGLSPGTYRVSEEDQPGWAPTFPPEKHYPGVMLSQGQVLLDLDFANRRTGEPGGEYDFGDAPWPYPEATHKPGPVWLGDLNDQPDTEPVMLRDPAALGDDNDNKPDETGFAATLVRAPGQASLVQLFVSVDQGAHQVYAHLWVDWNQDGDWLDSDEHWEGRYVWRASAPNAACVDIGGPLTVPSHALLGKTFARVRAYAHEPATGFSASGAGDVGEVCDYEVEVLGDGLTVDLGGVVQGFKWYDQNQNGIKESTEPNLSGWRIWLDSNQNGVEDVADRYRHTDGNGRFEFVGIPAGTYTVGEETRAGYVCTFPPAPHRHTVTVVSGAMIRGVNFGNYAGTPWPERDYGDAPTSAQTGFANSYPTTRAQGGASHDPYAYGNDVRLGASSPDKEPDGQPNADATGDGADEDGVVLPPLFIRGQSATITITGTGQNLANYGAVPIRGWIDFDQSGTWEDPAERYVDSLIGGGMAPGTETRSFTITVPANAPVGTTFARFRISTKLVGPTGYGGWGEVEDYQVVIREPLDYGDAPDTYRTLLVSNGARHAYDADVYLGTELDLEGDGQPHAAAAGDDNNGVVDDEDGVTFPAPLVRGVPYPVTVTASQEGLLNAWVDFNGNGSWAPDEQVFTDQPLGGGPNLLTFNVPANAATGPTFARFRFSTQPALTFEGRAEDGEVEDYPVEILDMGDLDFGDAPASYGSAWHTPDDSLTMGPTIDAEAVAQYSPAADGDDTHNTDDEDGAMFSKPLKQGALVEACIDIYNSGSSPRDVIVGGWIDFGGNYKWDLVPDTIGTRSVHVPPSSIVRECISFTVPQNAKPGNTIARFRLFEDVTPPGVSLFALPTGGGGLGEVEDYQVYIISDAPGPGDEGYDFGDAPDKYKTYHNSNGPYHDIGSVYLGSVIDSEDDGQPTNAADGDDTVTDDEDGVFPSFSWYSGGSGSVTIHLTGPAQQLATVAGWVDFNRNDNWDSGEQVVSGVYLCTGAVRSLPFTFSVPSVGSGAVYARFRVYMGETVSVSPFGYGGVGEVEDYRFYVLSDAPGPDDAYDYGDAPDSPESPRYPTLLANNGARHIINPNIFLGSRVESDPDGQPDAGAQGDDNDGDDDEDGINLLSPLVQGTAAGVQIIASVPGVLNAWIDFNGNGDWGDADDHVFINQPLAKGSNVLPVNVPAGAKPGATFARFRFSTQGGLSYEGEARDGEVEDYPVEIEVLTSAIGGSVWNDKNNNGGRETGEPGIAGVTLDLLDANGNVLFTTVTNASGRYDFASLPAGAYTVDVTDTGSVLSGFMLTTANDPAPVTLAPGQLLNVHFGYHQQIATMDFGDAPDPTYPTLLDSDGARHVVVMRTYLGAGVDAELNGKPSPTAQGDDNADTDDEDGVTGLPSQLIPGDKPTVTVSASVNGYLNAWIDFNRNGDWLDPGEQIFINEAISFGANTLSFKVPTDAISGPTLARFRYNTKGGLSFHGLADDGEVEDYLVEIDELRLDFGDAPDSYATTLARNGARHPIVPGVYMGTSMSTSIDDEIDGQDSADAQGDDSDGNDDEDGVVAIGRLLPGAMSVVKVTVSTNGNLYGYMDFNGDGDFDEPDDHIFSGSTLSKIENWHFNVPSSAVTGTTFARLRFSTEVVTSYDGQAEDGEVEDYQVQIEDPGNMDFGDAPDSYSTKMISDGARHVYVPGVRLGDSVDYEPDGQPTANADGDDVAGTNDDDGVTFTSAITPGGTTTVLVTPSTPFGYLNAWIDFNIDGDWNDPNERIVTNQYIYNCPHSVSFAVPSGAVLGETYARFRFSTFDFDISYDKLAHDGEVEDYKVKIGAGTWDCGDANGDGVLDVSDATYILSYSYVGGPPPVCPSPYCCADMNGDGLVGIQDAIAILNYLFMGLSLPSNACCKGPALPVSVPTIEMLAGIFDLAGSAGGEVILPIMVGDATGLEITAAAMHLTYDPDILSPVGASVEGTIAAGWDVAYDTGRAGADGARRGGVTIQEAGQGHIVIALAGARELSGPGTLVNVIFMVSGEVVEGQTSPIQLADISFSSGVPAEVAADAEFVVGEPLEPPAQPHIKWSQPPIEIDPNVDAPPAFCGWREVSTSARNVGSRRTWSMTVDDFHCLGPIPVTRVRWWGSYKAWGLPELPETRPDHWRIAFWANEPDERHDEHLLPETLIHQVEISPDRVAVEPVGTNEFPGAWPEVCFVYEVALEPHEFFHQFEFPADEQVFWISITAVYPEAAAAQNRWGWMTRPSPWREGAQGFVLYDEGPHEQTELFPGLFSPVFRRQLCDDDRGYDLCFELLTDHPWVKWDQPFAGLREWPGCDDHTSMALEPAAGELIPVREVADDWLCERADPVVAVAWHGSYLGYGYEACTCEEVTEPRRPDYFLLSIRTDTPPVGLEVERHPGELLWQYAAYDYDEVLVGYDRNPEDEPNEPVFRYSVRLPEDAWFRQEAPDSMCWFSVVAVFEGPVEEVPYHWGWTNRRHEFGTPALAMDDPQAALGWQEQLDAAAWPVDMSFTLYTVPALRPVAHWRFDETEGQVAFDSAGEHDGVVHGATWTDGKIEGALDLNGLNACVDCGDADALGPEHMTLMMWLQPRHMGGTRYLLSRARTESDVDYAIMRHIEGEIEFTLATNQGGPISVVSAAKTPLNEWSHVAVTCDGEQVSVCINGELDGSVPSAPRPFRAGHAFVIGALGGQTRFYHGKIDDVQLYAQPLPPEHIAELAEP